MSEARGQDRAKRAYPRHGPGLIGLGLLLAFAQTSSDGNDPRDMEITGGLELGFAYSDNISYTRDPNEDYLGHAGAHLEMSRQSGIHELSLDAAGFITRHGEFEQEEVDDFLASGNWAVTPDSATRGELSLSYAEETFDRMVPGQGFGDERAVVSNLVATGELSRTWGAVEAGLKASHRQMDFKDLRFQGVDISRDDEDRTENDLRLRLEDARQGAYQPALNLIHRRIDYDKATDAFGLTRDARVTEIKPELGFRDLAGFSGTLALGSYYRDFDGGDFDDIHSFVGNADVKRTLSPSLDLSLHLFRAFNEINLPATPGYFANGARLGGTYSLGAQDQLNASVAYIDYGFEQTSSDFRDVALTAGYTHKLSPKLGLELTYSYTDRDSDSVVFESYDQNRVDLVLHFGTGSNPLSAREWFYWVGLDTTPN